MPVRGNLLECWSCGRPPKDADAVSEVAASPAEGSTAPAPKGLAPARATVLVVGALVGVALVLAAVAVLVPTERTSTLRRMVDDARGDSWPTLATTGFRIDLPGEPTEAPWPAGPGHPAPGVQWTAASEDGVTTATVQVARVAPEGAVIDGRGLAEGALDATTAARGGTITTRTAVTVLGATGVDAVVAGGGGPQTHVRAVVLGGELHLLSLVGDPEDFQRMVSTFRLSRG